MSGKEAIRRVSQMTLADVRELLRSSTDATVRLVCQWRLEEPAAFEELAVYASGYPLPVSAMTQKARVGDAFRDWASLTDVTRLMQMTRHRVTQKLWEVGRDLSRTVEKRKTALGDWEYRLRPTEEAS